MTWRFGTNRIMFCSPHPIGIRTRWSRFCNVGPSRSPTTLTSDLAESSTTSGGNSSDHRTFSSSEKFEGQMNADLVTSTGKPSGYTRIGFTRTSLLWTKISGPHSSGYMGSTSADTVMLMSPRSDARIWNRSTKFVRSLTQAKTVELSLTSSTPGESSKTIRTGRLNDRKLNSETLSWTTSPLLIEYGIV